MYLPSKGQAIMCLPFNREATMHLPLIVEQLKSIFKPNRANCDTSTKFGTVILMGILNKSARLAT